MNWEIGTKLQTKHGTCTIIAIEDNEATLQLPDGSTMPFPCGGCFNQKEPRKSYAKPVVEKTEAEKLFDLEKTLFDAKQKLALLKAAAAPQATVE